jgi:hypothetical protein
VVQAKPIGIEYTAHHGTHDRVAMAQLQQWLQFAINGIDAMVVMLAMVNEGNGAIVVMVASAPRSTSSQKSSFHCLYTKTTLPWPWMEMGYNKCACKQRVEKM